MDRTVLKPAVLLSVLLLAVPLLAACIGGPAVAVPAGNAAGQAARPTPTPTPTPPSAPDTAATPAQSRVEVEYAAFAAISVCVDGIAADGATVRAAFDSSYRPEDRNWVVDAFTSDGNVTLGTWHVQDRSTLPVEPADSIARKIADPALRCFYPPVLMDGESTPPRFLPRNQTPGSDLPAGPIFTEEHAQMRVWSEVYSCFQDFPMLDSFTAFRDVGSRWLVEGRSDLTSYGLWEVDIATGNVSPHDDRAQQVASNCTKLPVALTKEQAEVRVWVTTADCFGTRPPLSVFTATPESPDRWIVEGRNETTGTLYGLWRVETSTGSIEGLDSSARTTSANTCFKP